jgi:hypothetical protein
MIFELHADDFRRAIYRDLTDVHEVMLGGRAAVLAHCPRCRRLILVHELAASPQANATAIFDAHAHVRSCRANIP